MLEPHIIINGNNQEVVTKYAKALNEKLLQSNDQNNVKDINTLLNREKYRIIKNNIKNEVFRYKSLVGGNNICEQVFYKIDKILEESYLTIVLERESIEKKLLKPVVYKNCNISQLEKIKSVENPLLIYIKTDPCLGLSSFWWPKWDLVVNGDDTDIEQNIVKILELLEKHPKFDKNNLQYDGINYYRLSENYSTKVI